MFQRILVPLDGSARAERALPIAGRLARASGGSVILLQVVVTPNETWVYRSQEMASTRHTHYAQLAAEDLAYLSSVPQLHGLREVETETIVYSGAVVAQTILDVACSHDVALIVMCSRGYTGLKRRALGSETQQLARKTPVSVLVLHVDGGKFMNFSPGETRPSRVLVALDGTSQAETVLVPAAYLSAALSTPLQGALHLAQVTRLSTTYEYGQKDRDAVARQQALSEAHAYLSIAKQRLHDGDLAHLNLIVTSSVSVNMDRAEMLTSMAEHGQGLEAVVGVSGCDVIALAMDGRMGRERRVTSSVTERLLGATKLPLLIVGTPSGGGALYNRTGAEHEMSGATTRVQCLEAKGSVIQG